MARAAALLHEVDPFGKLPADELLFHNCVLRVSCFISARTPEKSSACFCPGLPPESPKLTRHPSVTRDSSHHKGPPVLEDPEKRPREATAAVNGASGGIFEPVKT